MDPSPNADLCPPTPWDALSELGQWREPQLVEDAEIDVRGLRRFAVRGKSDDLGHVLPMEEGRQRRASNRGGG
jgi:hypothetical protein